jgi:heme exporter protein A
MDPRSNFVNTAAAVLLFCRELRYLAPGNFVQPPFQEPRLTRFSGHHLVCFRGERTVFEKLDFELARGGALVLRGPNGSGKSSLLRLMAGLARPESGVLAWDDEAVADDAEAHHRRLHYVGHADPVKPTLTVAENLRFWAALRDDDAASVSAAIGRALDGFAIAHLADLPGRYLSAGQRRRVNLARLLASPAALWLLDEPATALDNSGVTCLREAMAAHRAQGGIVVASAHGESLLAGGSELDLARFRVAS